jgi:tetratricopeptide (TPR) repeat protein
MKDGTSGMRALGRWRLVERLGAGGMGEVWRAEGPDGSRAAVKLLREEDPNPTERRRFAREAEVLRTLDHPNLVRALDSGQAEDGTLWLAMELLSGESLEERLRARGRLEPSEVARLGAEAAAGLEAAHARGLVHRDVKPGNLFLCDRSGVKVLDFGIAVRATGPGTGAEGRSETRLTASGQIIGTPSYMAPEQAAGRYTEDARTDVFALGAVLHHALSGRPPFWAGGNAVAELFRIVSEPPDALPADIPPALAALIGRALEKQPAQRWESMAALRRALETAEGVGNGSRNERGTERGTERAQGQDARTVEVPRFVQAFHLGEELRLVAAVVAEGVRGEEAFTAFAREVRARGGTAAAVRGSHAVGVFGGVEWLGNEPERALRAALASRAYASGIGVGTGKAVRVSGARGTVTGTAIAAAEEALRTAAAGAAPEDLAPVGACAETRRRVWGGFEVSATRVVAEKPAQRTLSMRDVGGVDVPMLGRDGDLARLTDLVRQAAEEARARTAIVLGPPGIGKSRLRYELQRRLEPEPAKYLHFEGRGESGRTFVSHGTIEDLLRSTARVPAGAPPNEARAKVESVVAAAGVPPAKVRDTVDFLGELLGTPFPETEHLKTARADGRIMADRIRLALGDLFEAYTSQATVILAIEDLHWADAASLELLDFLRLRLFERPLALIATARPELLRDRPDVWPGAERIELRELGARDTGALVERLLGRAEPAIVVRAAGNPYFAEELALAVRAGTDAGALPLTVEGAVQARLDQIDPREKDLLKRASVLGPCFWTEAAVALGEPEAPHLLAALRRRDLVVPRAETRLAGCAEWTFRHAVVQEVALGMLTDAQKKALHRLAAQWLGTRADAPPEETAEHYEQAGHDAAARPLWLRAASAADARGDSAQVMAFGDRALRAPASATATVTAAVEVHALRLQRLLACTYLGTPADAARELDALEALEADAGELIPAGARARVRIRRANHLQITGRRASGLEAAREAVAMSSRAGEPAIEAGARAQLAQILAMEGRHAEAHAEIDAAAARAATSGDSVAVARVTASRGYLAGLRGDVAPALAAHRDARVALEAAGDVRSATIEAVSVGGRLQALGDHEAARGVLEAALAAARALGLRRTEAWGLHNVGLAVSRGGDLAAGLACQDRALAIAREMQNPRLSAWALLYKSKMALEGGDSARAERAAEDATTALEAVASGAGVGLEAMCRALRAVALVALGQHEDALAECTRAFAARAVHGMEELEVDLLLAYHDALAALGRQAEAAAALDEARQVFETRLARIDDEHFRRTFREGIPSHARLLRLLDGTSRR